MEEIIVNSWRLLIVGSLLYLLLLIESLTRWHKFGRVKKMLNFVLLVFMTINIAKCWGNIQKAETINEILEINEEEVYEGGFEVDYHKNDRNDEDKLKSIGNISSNFF